MLAALAVPSHAAERRSPIDLPPATLTESLAELSRQAQVSVGTSDPSLPSLRVPPVHGYLTTGEVLARLLAGSDARAVHTAFGGWRVERLKPAPRFLAEERATQVPDILVQASKRATPLALYAGSVAIITADQLAPASAPSDSADIATQVSAVASTHFGPGRDKLFVRGVIDSGFTGSSQATTGQYLDDTRLNYNAPDPDLKLYDVASVEVLEGPQGSLYGAGALGGVIHIVTTRPQLNIASAALSGGIASTAHGDPGGDLAGVFNVPLIAGHVALRLVGYGVRDGGYIDNPALGRSNINGVRTGGGRASLRMRFGDWTMDAGGALQSIHSSDSQWADGDGADLMRSTPAQLGYNNDYRLSYVTVSRQWDTLHIVSTTAATLQNLVERYDASQQAGPAFVVTQRNRTTMLSNETRLSSQASDGSGWVLGWSLVDDHSRLDRLGVASNGGTTPREIADNGVREVTLFGEAGVSIVSGMVATAGLRATHAHVIGDATAFIEPSTIPIFDSPHSVRGAHAEIHVVPSLALSGRLASGLFLFARYQQGFRPGGFGISSTHGRAYSGDRIYTIEAGARVGRLDSRWHFVLTVARTSWHDILAEVVTHGGDPITENIGDGRILALEAGGEWKPVAGLQVRGGLFVNHSRLAHPAFASVLVTGSALPNVAPVGAQASLDYRHALTNAMEISLSANFRYFGKSRIGAGPMLDAAQGDYVEDRAVIRLGSRRRGVSLSVTNLLDRAGDRFAFATPYRIYDPQATPQQPRTIRMGFDAQL